ncbi:MAG: DNA recombination/repair protein RecA, partial [Pirellulales bacterium]|nr:DNA recombination/repair protein RecA [Pirellulales bacterium]
KVVKNKVAPPFRVAEFDMMHTNGISYEGDLLDLGLQHKVLERSGSWLRYGDQQLGQGRERAREFLKENRELAEEIRGLVMAANGFGEPVDDSTEGDGSEESEVE